MNTAYMSPLLNAVSDSIDAGSKRKSQPWKIKKSHFFEESDRARLLFSEIVNTKPSNIAIIPSTSYGIETAAKNLKPKKSSEIVILENQFPSNVYPWRRLARERNLKIKVVSCPPKITLSEALIASIDDRCAIVAIPNVLWTTGELIDLSLVRKKCDEVNASLVLDITQSAGAIKTDFKEIRPDFAVVSNYKWMLGPYSTGFLYVAPKYHGGQPLEEGWITRENSRDFSNLVKYTDYYHGGATRYDMGERANFALNAGVVAALEQLLEWGINNIEETLKSKNLWLAKKLQALGLSVLTESLRSPHFLSAQLPTDTNPHLLSQLEKKGVYLSERGGSLRITPHLWNNSEDFDIFIFELSAAL